MPRAGSPTNTLKGRKRVGRINALDPVSTKPPIPEKGEQYGLVCGWEVKTIGELATEVGSGLTPRGGSESYLDKGIPLVRSQNVLMNRLDLSGVAYISEETHESMARSQLWPGDILLNITGASIGRVAVVPSELKEANANQHVCRIRLREGANPHFVCLFLSTKDGQSQILGSQYGTTRQGLNFGQVRQIQVPVPPLPEQRAIAAVLRTVQLAKEATEKVITATRQLKASLMKHLFTYGSVPLDRADQVPLRSTDFGDVPAAWPAIRLSDCAYVQTGLAKGRTLEDREIIELPYLRVANVQEGHLDLREMKTIQLRKREVERFLLQPGDVVLTEGGDFDKLGRGFIWRGRVSPCVHQNHVFAVRTDHGKLLPEFLAYLAQSSYGKAYFLSVAHKTTNLACINTTKLKAFPVVLAPLAEQRLLAAQLAAVDSKLETEERRRAALEALFMSLLHHLMTGKMRIKDVGGHNEA